MAGSSDLRLLGCRRRAAERAAAVLRLELSRSGTSLRAIACTAPLLGMFGTVVMLRDVLRAYSLPGFGTCDCAGEVAETFVPLALSLPVSVFASCGSHYILAEIEILDVEMRVGILDLFDHLVRRH